jgi:ABC-type polysaccharide/polyol phosphate export permease
MGLLWSLIHPLVLLGLYTFVFGVVFKARWGGESSSTGEFALVLFSGLIVFNIFAETAGRAPALIVNNPNYVTKVIFPLELLPSVALGSAHSSAGSECARILNIISELYRGEASAMTAGARCPVRKACT